MNKLSIERIAALKHILSGFIDGYDTVDDRENFEAMRDSLSALDELIALKGDQVPVAMVDERQGSGGFCLTQHGRKLNLQHGTELFTAPQKPVVPVGWEVCSPEWCNKHKACHEAPRIWFESEDGTGPHYHPSEYTALQKLTDLPYDVLFNAIGKAVNIQGEALSISVKAFKAAIEAAGGIVKDGE